METLVYDLETDNLLPHMTQIWCLGVCPADDPTNVTTYTDFDSQCPSLREGLDRLSACDRAIGHNSLSFDWPALERVHPGTMTFDQQWDTMTVTALLEPKRRQIKLAALGQELGFPKGDHDDFTVYSEAMRLYLERDVEITARWYAHLQKKLRLLFAQGLDYRNAIALEHRVQVCLGLQGIHGFRLDVARAEALDADLRGEMETLQSELQRALPPRYRPEKADFDFGRRAWVRSRTFVPRGDNSRYGYVTGAPLTRVKREVFNPASRIQGGYRIAQEFGWRPSQFTAAGQPKMDEKTLESLDDPVAKTLARYFRIEKQVAQLSEGKAAWLRKAEGDRIRGYVRSCGTRTHRMSHSSPNVAQVDRDERMRACWLPDHGDVLVGVDADALELRMMACYLYPWDSGQYAESVLHGSKESGTDVHSINQQALGLFDRDKTKTFFYAMIYGAGDGKLGTIVVDDALQAGSPRPKGSTVTIGRAARARLQDGITGLADLMQRVEQRAADNKRLRLPDGRAVETGVRTALNSLLQGAGSVLMKTALSAFHFNIAPARGLDHGAAFSYCANIHDEVQFSCSPEHADAVGQAFVDAIQIAGWWLKLPVPFDGNYAVGENWAETH